jgi:hypothetical protein
MTLAEFLLARIAEDEAVAREWPETLTPPPDGYAFWVDPQGRPIYQPHKRVHAECEAKRRIMATQPQIYVLRCLALPYADHPDYRAEWAS